ncbi:MAG: aminotransferase class V-fold PLP-dependent enzyme, partial [Polaromonas sp.]
MESELQLQPDDGARSFESDVARWRSDFPVLRESINGKPLVYLDNAATTQKPQSMIDAQTAFYSHDNANVHRGVHTLSQRATDAYEAAREKVRRFINAASTKEIVFVRGTTEAINLVAQSYARPRLGENDNIIVSAMEHHSNIVPWQMACGQTGAELRVAPVNDAGELDLDMFGKLLGPNTRLVAITQMSNALGSITPVARIIE